MLADFERPNIVVCVLCKGSVSVRKGDKTRFFNHISIDHEVHFDLDLFYAISLMSDREKNKFVQLMCLRLQRLQEEGSSDIVENMEPTQPETSSDFKENKDLRPETTTVVTENMEKAHIKSNIGLEEK